MSTLWRSCILHSNLSVNSFLMQMDEIHVKSDVTYKGGKIYGSSLSPEDPIKTVFAIMVSSLQKNGLL